MFVFSQKSCAEWSPNPQCVWYLEVGLWEVILFRWGHDGISVLTRRGRETRALPWPQWEVAGPLPARKRLLTWSCIWHLDLGLPVLRMWTKILIGYLGLVGSQVTVSYFPFSRISISCMLLLKSPKPPEQWEINVCCVSPPACGTLLWQPELINLRVYVVFKKTITYDPHPCKMAFTCRECKLVLCAFIKYWT